MLSDNMKGMGKVLLFALQLAFILSLCEASRFWKRGWWRSSRRSVSRMSPLTSSTVMTSQQFNCSQTLTEPIEYFELNVTLSDSAILENSNVAQLLESASDRRWHYLTSLYTSYPVGDLQVQFTLIFNNTPSGNCSFSFPEEGGNSLSTFDPNVTVMTTCADTICSQATKITTTPQMTQQSDITTMNSTTPTSMNGSKCLCPCECATPISKEKSEQMIAAILEDLRIPKFSTSFSKRKLSSAPDYRISCTGIGLVGVFVMIAVCGVILIGDLKLFLFNARTALSHIRGHYGF